MASRPQRSSPRKARMARRSARTSMVGSGSSSIGIANRRRPVRFGWRRSGPASSGADNSSPARTWKSLWSFSKADSSKGHSGYNEFMFEDKKDSEKIQMHAQKDHEVTILNSEKTEIGERFTTPKGSPSRQHTLKNGDDQLTLNMGDQNVNLQMGDQKIDIDLGQQTTTAMQSI